MLTTDVEIKRYSSAARAGQDSVIEHTGLDTKSQVLSIRLNATPLID